MDRIQSYGAVWALKRCLSTCVGPRSSRFLPSGSGWFLVLFLQSFEREGFVSFRAGRFSFRISAKDYGFQTLG